MSKIKVEFTKVFKKKDDMGNLLGFADVTIDGLTIRGCRYCKSKDGNFLATPSEAYKNKDGETKYKYIVKIDDEDLMKEIQKAADKEYDS